MMTRQSFNLAPNSSLWAPSFSLATFRQDPTRIRETAEGAKTLQSSLEDGTGAHKVLSILPPPVFYFSIRMSAEFQKVPK